MLRMGDGDGQGIRGVRRFGIRFRQKHFDHHMDLILVGMTRTDNYHVKSFHINYLPTQNRLNTCASISSVLRRPETSSSAN